jgi:hypothetical protein
VHSAAWGGMPLTPLPPLLALGDVKLSDAFPKSIPGADGLESVFRALGVPPVDPLSSDDVAGLRKKYVSDFITAMFADIQKVAVGQCDCETACAPLTSFQPDSFKTYYDQAVPPQWIWEYNADLNSDGIIPNHPSSELPACRAIPVEGNADDGYTILDAEEAADATDKDTDTFWTTCGSPPAGKQFTTCTNQIGNEYTCTEKTVCRPADCATKCFEDSDEVVYQCPADGGYLPIMTATYKPHTLMKDHLQWYKFSKAKREFEPVKQAPEAFGQCVAACEASKTGYGTFATSFVSRCADQAMHKLFVVARQQRDAEN